MPYLGNDPNTGTLEQNATLKYVATAGQTAFTGNDSAGVALDIGVTSEARVFMNGVLLDTTDYTLSANTITLSSGATVNDEIVIQIDKQFLAANSYSKTEVDSKIAANDVTDDGNSLLNALIFGG
jgi:hypothetical protein